jgi:integrase
MRAAITAGLVRKLTDPCEVWDIKLSGLVLRVRESGRKTYVAVYGRAKKVTLGRAETLTPDEARLLARAVFGDVAQGRDPQVERRRRKAGTVRQFLEHHYGPWVRAHRRTGEQSLARLERFGDTILDRPLNDLSAWHLEQWRTSRRKANITNATINRDLDALRAALSKAVEWQIISSHPLRDVKRAKTDVFGRLRYLNSDEERRLRAALHERDLKRREGRARFNTWRKERGYSLLPDFGAHADHLRPITILALNTGLRRGELFGLQWRDVDLGAQRLTVRGAAAKTGLTRHVPLNTEAIETLRGWRTCSTPNTEDAYVFPGPDGNRMTTLKTSWAKVSKAAQLSDFTFHDLRHTFASKLVQLGVDLNTVRELLGHSDIKMTLRYAHLAPEHKAAAVAKLIAQ